jgi:hypothetical protein
MTINYSQSESSWIDLPVRPRVIANLSTGTTGVDVLAPKRVPLTMESAADRAGLPYMILVSISGQGPALPMPGGDSLYLQPDAIMSLMFGLTNTPVLPGFLGVLDAGGGATASMNLALLGPLPAALAGRSLHLAPLIFNQNTLEAGAPMQIRLQ